MRMANSVKRIIGHAGRIVTYRRKNGETEDFVSGIKSANFDDTQVRAAVRQYHPREVTGNIRQGDREVKIAAKSLSFTPGREDKVRIDGRDYQVEAINILSPGNEATLFVLTVRG